MKVIFTRRNMSAEEHICFLREFSDYSDEHIVPMMYGRCAQHEDGSYFEQYAFDLDETPKHFTKWFVDRGFSVSYGK